MEIEFLDKIALVVCTRNRPQYIALWLNNLRTIKPIPKVIIFVDSSDDSQSESHIREFSKNWPGQIHYLKSKSGLPYQRNIGIDFINSMTESDEITIISFTDDDCMLSKNYFSEVLKCFVEMPKCVAVTGIISQTETSRASWLHLLFKLRSNKHGIILKSGVTSSPFALYKPEKCEWMPGGSMNIARRIFNDLKFDSKLRMYGEDLKFSLGIKQLGFMYVSPTAKIEHLEATAGKDSYDKIILHTLAVRWLLSDEFPNSISKKWIAISVLGDLLLCFLNVIRIKNTYNQLQRVKANIKFLLGVLLRKDLIQWNETN